MVVRRQVRILFQLRIGERNFLLIAEALQVIQGQLLHLVGSVAALEVVAQAVALNGVCQDDGWLAGALVLQRAGVGGVDLAVIVAAAAQCPNLIIGHVLYQLGRALIAAEEVLAHIGAVVGLEGLVVTIGGGVHDVDQGTLGVLFQQLIPAAAPNNLDDLPAGAAEEGLQLLDDLGIAANRAVKALQVAVDHEGEVIQLVEGCDLQQAAGFWLVHLAIAQESPYVLLGGVLDAASLQVLIKACLVDSVNRAQAHGHGGEFPEPWHQAWVRVGRQPLALATGYLLAEAIKVLFSQAAFHESTCVHAR